MSHIEARSAAKADPNHDSSACDICVPDVPQQSPLGRIAASAGVINDPGDARFLPLDHLVDHIVHQIEHLVVMRDAAYREMDAVRKKNDRVREWVWSLDRDMLPAAKQMYGIIGELLGDKPGDRT